MRDCFYSRRKMTIEDAMFLKSSAITILENLKVYCISGEQYRMIRDYIESSAAILESDLRHTNNKLAQLKRKTDCGRDLFID